MRYAIVAVVLLSMAGSSLCANMSDGVVDKGRVQEMSDLKSRYGPKPEILHTFRQPEKRPPTIVSDTFTVLVVLPLVLLFILWAAIGVNVSGFEFGVANIAFHSGIGLIVSLMFTVFWKNMDMFLALKCLSGVLALTFVSGHFLLKGFAKRRLLDL